jgi:hypothetical protein
VLTQQALDPFVECESGLVVAEGLPITLKLGLERSIEHIRLSRTNVISTPDGLTFLLNYTIRSLCS